jgi:hypothetical protein
MDEFREPKYKYLTPELWSLLRPGLAELETSGKLVPPSYLHPDRIGYGALGLTPVAYKDVQTYYPEFRNIPWREVITPTSPYYEPAAHSYGDLLLWHFLHSPKLDIPKMFDTLQKIWNLGPTGYKRGRKIPASRKIRAQEYLRRIR